MPPPASSRRSSRADPVFEAFFAFLGHQMTTQPARTTPFSAGPSVVLSRGAALRTGRRRRGSNALPLLDQSIQNAPLMTVPDGLAVADHEHPHLMIGVLDVVGHAHMTHAELVQPMEWRMQGGPILEWGLG